MKDGVITTRGALVLALILCMLLPFTLVEPRAMAAPVAEPTFEAPIDCSIDSFEPLGSASAGPPGALTPEDWGSINTLTITGSSNASTNYIIGPVIVYHPDAATTLESGNWTRERNFGIRFSFTVEERSGVNLIDHTIPFELDLQSLLESGYFNDAANGDELVFTDNSDKLLYYDYDTDDFGSPTAPFKMKGNLTANTTHTFWCYIDPARTETSSYYSQTETYSSLSASPQQSGDDYQQWEGSGALNADITLQFFGAAQAVCPGFCQYDAAVRFQLDIPNDSVIISSTVDFEAFNNQSNPNPTLFYGEDIGNTPIYVSNLASHAARTRTSEVVAWSPANWVGDVTYTSPDLSTILQKVVNRGDWAADNYFGLFWQKNGGTALRLAYSWDHATGTPPLLDVIYYAKASVGPLVDIPVLRPNGVLTASVDFPSDIEFTMSGSTDELGHFTKVYGEYAKSWIKVTGNLSEGNEVVLDIYSGNDGYASTSDEDIFALGDDFTGTGIDASKWDETNEIGYGSAIAFNSMWLKPRYPAEYYEGTYNRTYFTWADTAGRLKVLAYDHDSGNYLGGLFGFTIANVNTGNLHEASVLHVIKAGTYAGHILVTTNSLLHGVNYLWRSDLPEDITSWSLIATFQEGNLGSNYPQIQEYGNGTLVYFQSVNDGAESDAGYQLSHDGGDNWRDLVLLVAADGNGANQAKWIYPSFVVSGNATYFSGNGYNDATGGKYRYVKYMQNLGVGGLLSGNWTKADGTDLGVKPAAGYSWADLDVVFNVGGENPFVLDMAVGDSSNPVITFVTAQDASSVDLRYAYYDAGWQVDTLGSGRAVFSGNPPAYTSGISIDPGNVSRVILGLKTASYADLQIWGKDGGWAKLTDVTIGSTATGYEPYFVRNYHTDLQIVFIQVMNMVNAGDWDAYIGVYPLATNKYDFVQLVGVAAGAGVLDSDITLAAGKAVFAEVLHSDSTPNAQKWTVLRASTADYNDAIQIYGDTTPFQETVKGTRAGEGDQVQTGTDIHTQYFQNWRTEWFGADNATVHIDNVEQFSVTTNQGDASYATLAEGPTARDYTYIDHILVKEVVSPEVTWAYSGCLRGVGEDCPSGIQPNFIFIGPF